MTPEEYPLKGLNVLQAGGGSQVLVLLHGWGRSASDLMPLADILASERRVVVFDLPGFGSSSPPPESGWGSFDYAELVRRYLKNIGVERATFIGHSFGGRISLRIASTWPNEVDKLILVGSHGLKPKRPFLKELKIRSIIYLGKLIKFIDSKLGLKLYTEKFIPFFASPDYAKSSSLRKTIVKVVNEDQSDNIKKIAAQTLLLWGENDTETPLEMARRFNKLIKNSTLIVLPNKGHDPYQGVGVQLCAYHIKQFLAEDQDK